MKNHRITKLLSVLTAISVATAMLTGCGSAANDTAAADSTAAPEETVFSYAGQTVTARVTAIDGNEVTFALGNLELGEMSDTGFTGGMQADGQTDGTAPEMPSDMTMPTDSEGQPEMPDGGSMPGMPSDAQDAGSSDSSEPPAKPDGGSQGVGQPTGDGQMEPPTDMQDSGTGNAQPAAMDGNMQAGGDFTMPFTENGDSLTLSVSDDVLNSLTEDSIVTITFGDTEADFTVSALQMEQPRGGMDMQGEMSAQGGNGGFGANADSTSGTAAETIDSDAELYGTDYTSETSDENALVISNGATASLTKITAEKTGDASNTESSDFYGINAAILATDGAQVTIDNATVSTDAAGGNAVFSYGSGTVLNISNSVIRTEKNNSGGIQTTGGASTNAINLDIETQGNSAAAIRSDRGGGTVNVTGGTYVTNGTGSPAIYSTADITVSDATLTANSSEALVIEGKNSITLNDCTVTGAMSGTYGTGNAAENIHNVMIYQSMSGDADVGESSFSMTGGTLTALQGDMIYVTNTNCQIYLSGVELVLANENLLTVAGNDGTNGWGSVGSNGGTVVMRADGQVLTGIISVDSISSLSLTMKNGSTFTGTINPDGEAGTVSLTLEAGCTWTLTDDAYLTSFDGDASGIVTNGYHVYVNGTQIA